MTAPTAEAHVERRDFYVYRIDNLAGVPIYVGAGSGTRRLYTKGNSRVKELFNAGLTLPAVRVAENLTIEEASTEEVRLIKLYGRKDLGLGSLENRCDGGRGWINACGVPVLRGVGPRLRVA
jgi:hypothetical protein